MNISLKDFLEQHDKLPEDNKLSPMRISILKLCGKYADKVYKTDKYWQLEFDEGAYQGSTIIKISKQNLSPLALLNALDSVGWPGHTGIVEMAEKSIMEILEKFS